jgi:hypothetical protein
MPERSPRHAAEDPADIGLALDVHSLRAISDQARQLLADWETYMASGMTSENLTWLAGWSHSAAAVMREMTR